MQNHRIVAVYLYRLNQNVSDLVFLEDGEEFEVPIVEAIRLINDGDTLYIHYEGHRTPLQIVSGPIRGSYLRSKPNGVLGDNLLRLPQRRR
jgi:hypothetical protein